MTELDQETEEQAATLAETLGAEAENIEIDEAETENGGDAAEAPSDALEVIDDGDAGDDENAADDGEPAEGAVDDDESAEEPSEEKSVSSELAKKLSLPIVVGIAVVALVAGLLVGMFLLGGPGSSLVSGKTTVGEAELSATMATYTYKGASGTVTVGEVIEQSSSLAAAAKDEGVYNIPTADTAMGVVRNKILVQEAEAQGITVTDEEVTAYAATSLGTDDFEAIASSYGMDADAVQTLLRESCLMGKLRDSIVTEQDLTMPEPPAEPSGGSDDAKKPTKAYAEYIIALAGDEWDAKKDTWASADGPFASGLSQTYDISSKGATYEAATAAYYIAYQQYSAAQGAVDSQWTDYVNGILSNATIHIYTLLA